MIVKDSLYEVYIYLMYLFNNLFIIFLYDIYLFIRKIYFIGMNN